MTTELLDDYFTEAEAARQLGICKRTLIRWRVLREGPAPTKIGRRVFFRRDTITAWLKSREDKR